MQRPYHRYFSLITWQSQVMATVRLCLANKTESEHLGDHDKALPCHEKLSI